MMIFFYFNTAINAENAAHKSDKFTVMAIRTREEYLKDLATNYVSTTSLDSGSKLSKLERFIFDNNLIQNDTNKKIH